MYKDAKVRFCPVCGKNMKHCKCVKEEQKENKDE